LADVILEDKYKNGSEKKVGKLFKRGESGNMCAKLKLKGKINTK
jgi:hypothetical protein